MFLPTQRVQAVEYEVEGTIEQTINHPYGRAPGIYASDFTVFVRDCGWLIQTRRIGTNRLLPSFSEIGSTNGRDIFQLSRVVRSTNAIRALSGVAEVYSNSVPVGFTDVDVVGHLWLMFASGCYLQTVTNGLLTPVFDSGASAPGNPNMKKEAAWEWIDASGSLPWRLTYYDYVFASKRTNAVYQATGRTNSGDLTVPSGFIFEEFIIGDIVDGYSNRLRRRTVATVTALRQYCSRDSLMPAPQGTTVVADLRVKMPKQGTNAPPLVVYKYDTNKGWLSTNEARKEFLDDRAQLAAGLRKKRVSPAALVGLACILLAPAAWFMFRPKAKSAAARPAVRSKRR